MSKGFSFPIPAGFRQPKKLNRKQQERRDKIQSFLNEYGEMCKKHNLKLDAYFVYEPRGQRAILDVLFMNLPDKYKDKPELIQKDREEISKLVDPFLKDYDALKLKHRIEFEAICDINDKGIFPKMNMRDIPEQQYQVKDWDEAKKENEAQKKAEEEKNADTNQPN